jgi:hypothetical protein
MFSGLNLAVFSLSRLRLEAAAEAVMAMPGACWRCGAMRTSR